MSKRYIFVGDIHGCFEELMELMELISPTRDDVVISLGDFLDRGPSPDKCLDYWIDNDFLAVLGNHDERFVRWSRGEKVPISEGLPDVINLMGDRTDLIRYLESLPYYLKFEEINSLAVHAAIDINCKNFDGSLTDKLKNIALRGRYVRDVGGKYEYLGLGKHNNTDRLWADLWEGSTKVFYGHTPFFSGFPKFSKNTIGLDTGAVYGIKLTAASIDLNGDIAIHSVKSKKKYWDLARKEDVVII